MNSILAVTILSLIILFVGYPYALLLGKVTKAERLGLSFLLGLGLSTLTWFTLSLFGAPLNLHFFTLGSLLTTLFGYFLIRITKVSTADLKVKSVSNNLKIVVILIGIILITNLAISSYHPITAWDALALYDFRGHTIALSHNLDFLKTSSYYVSYPLLTSLFHALIYELGGNNPQAIYTLIFVSFLLSVFGRIYSWTNTKTAVLTTLVLTLSYELFSHATFAYTNLAYTVYFILGLMTIISLDKNSRIGSYLVAGLLIGLSVWTRSAEPYWAVMILLIIWRTIQTKNFLGAFFSISTIMLIKHVWISFHSGVLRELGEPDVAMASIFSTSTYVTIWHNLPRLWDYIYLYVFDPYIGLWFLLIPCTIILLIKQDRKLAELLLTTVLLLALSIFGIMIFSVYYTTWDGIGDSARRMLLFVVPLLIISGNYALYLTNKKGKE